VKFTPSLDVFELCSPELQSKLIPMRERFKAEEERQDEERKQVMLLVKITACQNYVGFTLNNTI